MSPILGIVASSKASFTPASIANLKAWYDASDTATITASGSAVTQWNDKSGNAYNVTQGTAAQRPVTGTRTQNGLNMIDFQTNDVLVASTASNWTFMHNATGCTIFMAIFSDTETSYSFILDTAGANTAGVGAGLVRDDNPAGQALYSYVFPGGGNRVSDYHSSSLGNNVAKYFNVRLDNANATVANRALHQINAGSVTGTNVFTSTASSSAPAHALYIGGYDTAPADGFNGAICEILIYSGLVSDTDRGLLNTYLATKWGI